MDLGGQEQNIVMESPVADSLAVVVAAVIVLLTILIFLLQKFSSKARGVLLMGLCDAGKTALFCKIVHGQFKSTLTSMQENSSTVKLKSKSGKLKSMEIIDLPGHERLRQQCFDRFRPMARAIVFVVDCEKIQSELKDVAEFLFHVISVLSQQRGTPALLIACNKQDAPLAKSAQAVRSLLERELNTVNVTRTATLGADDSRAAVRIGRPGKQQFEFGDLPFPVQFVETRCTHDDADIQALVDWVTARF